MESKDESMTELMKGIENGQIQLPDFQRGWVWSETKIKKLIASITCGYPISAAMSLAYGGELRFKYRPFEGTNVDSNVKPKRLILDGQQRLTSIYQSMYSQEPVSTKTDNNKPVKRYFYISIPNTLNGTDREDAIISIPEDKVLRTNFNREIVTDLSSQEKEFKEKMFPVNLMFNIAKAAEWQNKYYAYIQGNTEAIREFTEFFTKILLPTNNYQMPVIRLDENTPKEAVCQVFENVNTGGVPLTVFELVTAIFAMDDFDLRKDWDKRKNRSFTGDILKDTVTSADFLIACTLLSRYKAGGTVSCKRKDVMNLSFDSYKQYADELEQGFIDAEKLLQRNRIFSAANLPYSTQLIPLSVLCSLLAEDRRLNVSVVINKLEQWLWCGIFGELYGGANESRYVQDVQGFMAWVSDDSELPKTVRDAYFNPTRLLYLQTRQSAAYKGVLALILKNNSRDFISGQEMDFTVFKQEYIDIHHVFPKAYCIKQGLPSRKWNSIINKTPISYSTNREIGGVAPSKYLNKIENSGKATRAEIDSYLESHWLDVDCMRTDNFDQFIIKRAGKLLDAISEAMGKPISGRDSEDVITNFGGPI